MRKRMMAGILAVVMVLATSITAFAGTWKQDAKGWQWDYGNGTKAANKWEWCDGNGDGIAECYYFDANGYCLMNTTTPDGYTVNKDGAWTVNGVVQTKNVGAGQTAAAVNSGADRLMYLKMYYGLPGETEAQKNAKMQQVLAMGRSYSDMEQKPLTYAAVTEFLNRTDWPNMSDYDKAKAVYARIACGYNGNTFSAPSRSDGAGAGYEWQILAYKHGVCAQYDSNFRQLLELVGFPTEKIKALYYNNHVETLLNLDGNWYRVDASNPGAYVGGGSSAEAAFDAAVRNWGPIDPANPPIGQVR